MATPPKQPIQTKKHLARMQREKRQQRYLLLGSVVTVALVLLVILYGALNETVLKSRQPVAIVNGKQISTRDFQTRVRYNRQQLINSAAYTYQIAQLFGDSPETQYNFVSQLSQIQAQMESQTIGQQTLDQLIDEALIRQEAEKRGITISQDELQAEVEGAFGFFENGTPTPSPTFVPQATSTLSALQMTLVPPTATATATQEITATATMTATQEITSTSAVSATPVPTATATLVPSITPTPAPSLTPTPFTRQLFDEQYDEVIQNFKDSLSFDEADLRNLIEAQLLRTKVQDAVLEELGVKSSQEQVWARHILVPDEAQAITITERLNNGEDFVALAAEFSTDTSNKDKGGDLDWFGRGAMVKEFEDAAFALQVGEISQPVQTTFGWHIIQALGHEDRPLTAEEYQSLREERFTEWLTAQRDEGEVETRDIWQERVPEEPAFPLELVDFINQVTTNLSQPTAIPTTVAAP